MKNSLNLCIAIVVLVVLGCSCPAKLKELANKRDAPPPRATPVSTSPSSTSTPSKNENEGDYDLTMDKYEKISIGTPRTDVERILGGKGTEISSSTGGGMRFTVNKWEGDNFKSVILSFKNDKVMTKSQVGLK
ncbi:MAG: hypothetical protein ABJA02_13045 [Acidobacteriota bacterium]